MFRGMSRAAISPNGRVLRHPGDLEWLERCYRRDWLRTWTKRTAALIWDGLVLASRMRAS
jgi:hypothetical protein